MLVRTRFAPSPTGDLHLGSARTALFSWLYARKQKGEFLLRIEDTDRARSTQRSVDSILEGMQWLGLDFDHPPLYQTTRFDHYPTVIETLLASGHAYRCTCSKERLDQCRHDQIKQKLKPRYDRQCRDANHRDPTIPHVIRFRNPLEGAVSFDDAVYGTITVQNKELDDLIIARSEGTPTYNLTAVIDDAELKITHVIRGDDHINNTPRQINLFKALGLSVPTFAHLPMILNEQGKRLSKREGATNILDYQKQGYLPEALCNYLVRLGWSYGDQEIFSREAMIHFFDIHAINKTAACLDPNKLLWLNQHYLKSLPTTTIADRLRAHVTDTTAFGTTLDKIIPLQVERCKTLNDIAEKSRYFYEPPKHYDEKARKKFLQPEIIPVLEEILNEFETLSDWSASTIDATIRQTAKRYDLGLGKLAQPLRIAVTGTTISPAINRTLDVLGQEKTCQRIQCLLDSL